MTNGINSPRQYPELQPQQPIIPRQTSTLHRQVKQHKKISLSIPVFAIMIVAIIVAFIMGFFISGEALSSELDSKEAEIAQLKKTIGAANKKVPGEKNGSGKSSSQDNDSPHPITAVGGAYEGKVPDDNQHGDGYVTLQNNSKNVLGNIGVTVAYLDASGNMVDENYPQLQSQLQPGKKANVDVLIDLTKRNIKYFHITQIGYTIGNDQNNMKNYPVGGPKIAVQ